MTEKQFDNVRISHMILDMGFGGSEKLVQDITISAKTMGLSSNIICFDAIVGNTEPLSQHGITVELFKRRPVAFDHRVCSRVIGRLKAMDVSLIHAHDLSSLAYAVAAGAYLRVPVVMTEHSRHYIEERLLRRLEKRLLCLGVNKLVEVSPELARASIHGDGIPSGKVAVIENGVDAKSFAAVDGQAFRQELGLRPDETLVGMVGRLEEIKGPGILLEAFAGVCRDIPAARLAFVGQGSLGRSLRERAQALGLDGRVNFLGVRADIPMVMAGLDVLVLPSLSEGLPLALLEGMAAARAVLATAVGRVPGIVRQDDPGANGVLAVPGDARDLAGKMSALLRDGPRRAELGRQAREYVRERYDKGAMMKGYAAVYAEALARGRRS